MLNSTSDMGSMSTSLTKHLTLQLTSVRDRISQNQTTAVLSATNTKSTAIRKLSNFVESFDEFDYPTPCQDAPSYGDPDNDTTRYHLLRRVQHALDFPSRKNETESSSSRELLCIFPFFPLDLEHTALVTYGQECDGALILRADNNDMKIESYPNIDNGIPTFILHLDLTSQGHKKWKQDLLYYLSNTVTRPYGWIHWASPRRYTFIGFVRSAIREAEETEGERNVLETRFDENFISQKHAMALSQNFHGSCTNAWVWQWEATWEIIPSCYKSFNEMECQPPKNTQCFSVSTTTGPWSEISRLFQRSTPRGERGSSNAPHSCDCT